MHSHWADFKTMLVYRLFNWAPMEYTTYSLLVHYHTSPTKTWDHFAVVKMNAFAHGRYQCISSCSFSDDPQRESPSRGGTGLYYIIQWCITRHNIAHSKSNLQSTTLLPVANSIHKTAWPNNNTSLTWCRSIPRTKSVLHPSHISQYKEIPMCHIDLGVLSTVVVQEKQVLCHECMRGSL